MGQRKTTALPRKGILVLAKDDEKREMEFEAYGYARATLDIDIFIRPNLGNAKRTMKAQIIRMKRAAGRAKDREDLKFLRNLKKRAGRPIFLRGRFN
jgi:hypothetical protein